MTPSLKTESEPQYGSSEPHVLALTAGQLLRKARLKAGIHLAVLSVTLKVPVRQLEALEADELDPSKGPVFYRGLASSVCRHLQTDAAPILALLPQTTAQLQPLRSSIEPEESEGSLGISRIPWGRMVSSKVFWGAALMLLLTGAFLWLPGPSQWAWLDDVKSLMADEVVSQEVTEPMVVTPVLQMGASSPSTSASTAASVSTAASAPSEASAPVTPLVTAPAAAVKPQVEPAPPAKPVSSAAPAASIRSDDSPEWVFSATADSWLEVRNAQKTVVWSGVVKAGESTRIKSPLPVSVVVGRAQVVSATLRGQPFDLKPHTQVTVARFEVKE
jgi:cytoskeleton protein RodZ